jgi:hypothetical protein
VIQHVDRALERLLRLSPALGESLVDISFDAPDRTWGAARTRPTVNAFLWEISRNPMYRSAGVQLLRDVDSGAVVGRRPVTPVVDLHYMLTAWTTEKRDEHQLLGALVECVLAHQELPDGVLPEPLAGKKCRLQLAPHEKRPPGEFWSALDGRLRPGVQLEISIPLEVFSWTPMAPPPTSVAVSASRLPEPVGPPDEPGRAGLARRRANGAVVMEGRTAPPEAGAGPADAPAGAGSEGA